MKEESSGKNLLAHVKAIVQTVESAESLQQINNLKKLKADGDYYRIRLGDYRIGLKIERNRRVCKVFAQK